jgi:hypothetical protein
MTGFIGTASISEALSGNGNHDLAYKLLTNKQYPSWLYSVVNGATSIWERLNSYTVENGFGGNNSMNSFNHYSFGAVAAWMYNYSLGIQRHPTKAGFKEFILMPTPDPNGQITEAKGIMIPCMVVLIALGKVQEILGVIMLLYLPIPAQHSIYQLNQSLKLQKMVNQ